MNLAPLFTLVFVAASACWNISLGLWWLLPINIAGAICCVMWWMDA